MRYIVYISLLSFWIFSYSAQAENWHPFPFKVAYYGVKTSLGAIAEQSSPLPYIPGNGPITKGFVVDALYLDEAFAQNNLTGRKRSLKYPVSQLNEIGNGSDFKPFIKSSTVTTSADSQTVIAAIATYITLSGTYFPKNIKLGNTVINNSGIVTGLSVTNLWGIQDSIATITMGANSLLWSKKFGIVQSFESWVDNGLFRLELVGIKDISLGYQDNTMVLQKPEPGDEFHFLNLSKGNLFCPGTFGTPSTTFSDNTFNKMQVKVLSSEQEGATVKIVVSNPNDTTGIEYTNFIEYYSNTGVRIALSGLEDSLHPVGTAPFVFSGGQFIGELSFLGWADSLGNQMKIMYVSAVDLPTVVQFFTCSKMPFAALKGGPDNLFSFCIGAFTNFQYPVYGKIGGRCVFGTPFDSVTITSTLSKTYDSIGFRITPNPVESTFRISGILDGEYAITDALGKVRNRGIVSDGPIEINSLPSGMYFVQIIQDGKISGCRKLFKK
jgi:hypothetical protein